MALVTVDIGGVENAMTYEDTENFSDGVPKFGLRLKAAPTHAQHAARKTDVDAVVALLQGESFITIANSGNLSGERAFAVSNGLKKTDGGANGSFTVEIDAASKPTIAGVISTDNLDIDADSKALRLGADQDATLLYDGTDLLINPRALGTGKATVQGPVNTTEHYQVDGTQVVTNQQAAIASLTDSTGGTANDTLVDVTTVAVADPAKVNDNFADVAAKLSAILTALRNHGLIAT